MFEIAAFLLLFIGGTLLALAIWAAVLAFYGTLIGSVIYLIWNVCQVSTLFGAGDISFLQCFGIGVALVILRMIIGCIVTGERPSFEVSWER